MKKKEEAHQAEVNRLKEEFGRVMAINEACKRDMEGLLKEKVTAEKQRDDLKTALSTCAQNDQKIKQLCTNNEEKANKVEAELAAHKKESAGWLSELNLLNRALDRKLVEFTFLSDSNVNGCPHMC